MRFKEFNDKWNKCTFNDLANYKKGPFGSALKKEIFVPKSLNTIKVYEQQNVINKNWKLERYYISSEYYQKMKSFTVYPNDILISCAGTIGESYILPREAEVGVINQALMIMREKEIIDKRFLLYLFENMIDLFSAKYSNGSAIRNIPPFSDLKKTITFIPDMEEQLKIVNLLEKIKDRIDTQIKIIEAYQSLIKGICTKLITSKTGNTKIEKCLNCNTSSLKESDLDEINSGNYPVYGANGYIKSINNYQTDEDSIGIIKDGAGVGRMMKLKGKYSVLATLNFLTARKGYNIDYIYYALKNKSFKKLIVGSGIPHIYFKDYKHDSIYIPDNNDEIIAIVKILNTYDTIITNEKNLLSLLEQKKAYLLKNMFI